MVGEHSHTVTVVTAWVAENTAKIYLNRMKNDQVTIRLQNCLLSDLGIAYRPTTKNYIGPRLIKHSKHKTVVSH